MCTAVTMKPYKSFLRIPDNAGAVEGLVIYVAPERAVRYVASRVRGDLLFVSLLLFSPQERPR